jgi:hypothetical protein
MRDMYSGVITTKMSLDIGTYIGIRVGCLSLFLFQVVGFVLLGCSPLWGVGHVFWVASFYIGVFSRCFSWVFGWAF